LSFHLPPQPSFPGRSSSSAARRASGVRDQFQAGDVRSCTRGRGSYPLAVSFVGDQMHLESSQSVRAGASRMIDESLLRWTLSFLFVLSAADCFIGTVVRRGTRTEVIGYSVHGLMALAMVASVWPLGAGVAMNGFLVLSVSATMWFGAVALRNSEHRRVAAYHALMMLAMAWMFATMSGLVPIPGSGSGADGLHGSGSTSGMGMSGMDMQIEPAGATSAGVSTSFVVGINWVCLIVFADAAAWWMVWLFVRRAGDVCPSRRQQVRIGTEAITAAGMAVMFATML
jgi:hypothetical protein